MENHELSPGSEKTPEQIQEEMAQTRESLTEKVAALEHQVLGTVQTATDTLSGTVEAVKSFVSSAPETVRDAAAAVVEKLSEVLDVSSHVQKHPWTAVGTSAALGCLTGWLIFRDHSHSANGVAQPAPVPVYTPPAPPRPGVFDELFTMLGRKLREVAETAIDSASAAVNKTVREEVPRLVDAAAGQLTAERFGSPAGPERKRVG